MYVLLNILDINIRAAIVNLNNGNTRAVRNPRVLP